MFEGFTLERIDVGDAVLRVRHGGSGPAGPAAARSPAHARHLEQGRAPAGRTVHGGLPGPARVRRVLQAPRPPRPRPVLQAGHGRRLRGADAGTRARAVLPSPATTAAPTWRPAPGAGLPRAGRRLCLMEGIPIGEALARCDATFAASWYHWFFFGQTDSPPSGSSAPTLTPGTPRPPSTWAPEAFEDYRRAIHDPDTVHAMIETTAPGCGIDRQHDEADRPRAAGSAARCCSCGPPGRHGRPLRRPARHLA